jgi:hypothetical protein
VSLENVATESGKALGPRSVVSLLPSALLALLVVILRISGAPGEPQISKVMNFLEKPGAGLVLLVVVVLLATIILQPLQIAVVQLLEGYWEGTPSAGRLASLRRTLSDVGREIQRRRYQTLDFTAHSPHPGVSAAQRFAAKQELRYFPETEEHLLPTRLGNILRATEDRAGGRYGLSTNKLYPRLYPFLKEPLAKELDDSIDRLDLAAHLCVAMLSATVASLGLLLPNAWKSWWMLVPIGTLMLAWLAYRAALTAAKNHGELLETAFDLHRFDLIAALHYPLPADPDEEYDFNTKLSELLKEIKTSTREDERSDKRERLVPRIEYRHAGEADASAVDWNELLGSPDRETADQESTAPEER